jgi:hypothetical protein
VGTNLREFALGMLGVKLVDAIGQHQLQHGVAEEFQALIVVIGFRAALVGNGRMGESLNEEVVVFEFVVNGALQFLELHDGCVAFACRGMLTPRNTSGRKIQL